MSMDTMNDPGELLPGLFRKEFARMVAVITRLYGLQHIEIAEDVVSETFLQATADWKQKGIPANPTAWLYRVAKHKTLYLFRRNKIFTGKVLPALQAGELHTGMADFNFSEQHIRDSQLQMMFAVCDPVIAAEAQIGLALRILCGFNIEEIADAFLTNKETINKRLYRAKEKLRQSKVRLEFPAAGEANRRLDNVLHILYLLFNEGYYSTTHNTILREDLCYEALRLALLLTWYNITDQPKTNALVAMMCFHTSRFDARQTGDLPFIGYDDQDESLWNRELIAKGIQYLERSACGLELSSYHLEAGIAFWHCRKAETTEKWVSILQHYDLLLQLNYSPVVALNRTYALYKVKGREAALLAVRDLPVPESHFYFTLLGELYTGMDSGMALANYAKAMALAKTDTDRLTLRSRIEQLAEQRPDHGEKEVFQ